MAIHLCFVWHMHQPFYKDLATGEYRMPWTRYHALKDYYGMVKILGEFPEVHQTFNLVPSMIAQIDEYASGRAADPFLDCAVKPASDLTAAEREFVLKYFFQANPGHLIYRYPRYGELYDRRQRAGSDTAQLQRDFNEQDLRDLQVLSQLAWFDEEYQAHDDAVRGLIDKQRSYSLADHALMARKQQEILARVVPTYREFAARGQIEISTTPYYHPILPLICDSDIAAISHPQVTLPERFQYPQDALHQLKKASEFMEREFGRAPSGLWPSEGSVSDAALALAAEAGFEWAATDNGVLARTLRRDADPSVTYHSYRWQREGRRLSMIFRDHFLSDQVGFVYSNMEASEAADHFLSSIRANARPLATGSTPVLVPVILDGENAWEYYFQNGRPFLRELYARISESTDLKAVTVSEALRAEDPWPLDRIWPGSWIDANFDIWIGAQEDNLAWEYLLRARRKFDECAAGVPEDDRNVAFEELLIAEGSDWCWWYGPEHQSENRAEFDQLYRDHLANVYRALHLAPPEELSHPILTSPPPSVNQAPANPIQPVIDGQVTSFFEWRGAGRYRVDTRPAAMHGERSTARDLYYGADQQNFYLRLDLASSVELHGVDLRLGDRAIPLLGNSDVQTAHGRILESRVPFSVLGKGGPSSFQVAVSNGSGAVELIPPEGSIALPEPAATS
jgi:alpha-amylase/alpha-mannosidase (GH57 family)